VVVALSGCGRIDFGSVSLGGVHSQLDLEPPQVEPLADFPLLVVLDDTRADRTLLQPDASDLRFVDAAGTVLAHEIEQLGAPGGDPLVAWVRLPMLAPGIQLTVTYGGDPMPVSTDSVWSGDFVAVWHLGESTAVRDSTANHLDGTATGTAAVTGTIGGARSFSGSDWIAVPGAGLDLTVVTISGWIDERVATTTFYSIVSQELGNAGLNTLWLGDAHGKATGEFTTMVASSGVQVVGAGLLTDRWTHLAATVDGSAAQLYIDGAMSATIPLVGPLLTAANPIFVGADRNGTASPGTADSDFVDGMLDEVRIERVTRSPAWIANDDASQHDRVIQYGPIEH
jgi:hypothetical protein